MTIITIGCIMMLPMIAGGITLILSQKTVEKGEHHVD